MKKGDTIIWRHKNSGSWLHQPNVSPPFIFSTIIDAVETDKGWILNVQHNKTGEPQYAVLCEKEIEIANPV